MTNTETYLAPAAPIGIFDSGLGGLTVARQIAEFLPQENLIYLGDTLRCPYGPRPAAEVREFALQDCRFLQDRGVKLIIIACNTATAVAREAAQEEFSVPIIGVINPGARAAVRTTRNRKVGVIGTEGTIASGAYERALLSYDAGLQILSVATPDFVPIVEEGLSHNDDGKVWLPDEFFDLAHRQLDPLVAAGIDTLVLGCTHYPILAPALQRVVGPNVTLINSAEETAHSARTLLTRKGNARGAGLGETGRRGQRGLRAGCDSLSGAGQASRQYFTTGEAAAFEQLGSRIMGHSISPVTTVVL